MFFFTLQTAFHETKKSNSNYGNKEQFAQNSNDLKTIFSYSVNVLTAINTHIYLSFTCPSGICRQRKQVVQTRSQVIKCLAQKSEQGFYFKDGDL